MMANKLFFEDGPRALNFIKAGGHKNEICPTWLVAA